MATGPNAWIQRLVPSLRSTYNLEIHTLFIYKEDINACPTINFFKNQKLDYHLLNSEDHIYIADQVKAILKLIKVEKFNILVANLVIPALYAATYLKSSNIPVIGVLHSNDAFYRGVISKFIKGESSHQLTAAVAVSNYINELCKSETYKGANYVIPCGTPVPKGVVKRNNKEHLSIIYAGRLVIVQKQIIKLTSAFLNASIDNKNLEFSVYGSGEQEQAVEKLIKNTDKSHKVNFHGAVPPSEMLKVMSQHHVFTLMSDYEGMPVALMEAMACGVVPVCLQEESGINEIIDNGINGFIVKDRNLDYQEKLELLQKDHELWQTMSNNARQSIINKYSTDITTKKWASLLESFRDRELKPVRIPYRIKLEGELLVYGDNRKPSQMFLFQEKLKNNWLSFKLFVRPRARLRALMKNEK